MHKPLKTNGQSRGDVWPPKTAHDCSRGDGNAGAFFWRKRMPLCLEEWMERLDGETRASFKSHACRAFLKCNTGLIIKVPPPSATHPHICHNINCRRHLDGLLTYRRKKRVKLNSEGLQPTLRALLRGILGEEAGAFINPRTSTNLQRC